MMCKNGPDSHKKLQFFFACQPNGATLRLSAHKRSKAAPFGGTMSEEQVTTALSPVHDHPGDPSGEPTSGVALCMSGGGYRAMLFHLGSLIRLNQLGFLKKLTRVSSVSGGSITNGVLGLNWKKLAFDANGVATNFDDHVTKPIRGMAGDSIDVSSILEGVLGGVSKHVSDHYNEHLYKNATLQDLPDDGEGPCFIFNATSLQTGVLWRFSKPYMGSWRVGLVNHPTVQLATAVAASSAFPPLLSPCELTLDPAQFDPNIQPPPLPNNANLNDFRKHIELADGGVYDNLGLETAWKSCRTILVSNGGGALDMQQNPKNDWVSQTNRILMIIYAQVVTLRTRSIIELYKLGVRDGAFWGIGSDIKNYGMNDALACSFKDTTALAQTSTRLSALKDDVQEKLIDWGYAITDAAVRKHVAEFKNAPAPSQSPYGTFHKAI
jgi:NTE family protein